MRGYELTAQAESDVDAIADYIAEHASVERAVSVVLQIRQAFRKLSESPGIGHFRDDLLDRRYKFWSVYSYLIAYRYDVKPIRIIAVVHGARDLDAFFDQRH